MAEATRGEARQGPLFKAGMMHERFRKISDIPDRSAVEGIFGEPYRLADNTPHGGHTAAGAVLDRVPTR